MVPEVDGTFLQSPVMGSGADQDQAEKGSTFQLIYTGNLMGSTYYEILAQY